MNGKAEKQELWKQKVGRTHAEITKWNNSEFTNFQVFRWYKDKKTDEFRRSYDINVENFADVVELVRMAEEFLGEPVPKKKAAPAKEQNYRTQRAQDFEDDDIGF